MQQMTQQNWKQSKELEENLFLAGNKFNNVLSDYYIAEQIAQLINSNNRLTRTHSAKSIIANPVKYFVELHGQIVVGCIGIVHVGRLDKILHLSVIPTMRNIGIGKRLISKVVLYSHQDTIFMHIREDNISSLILATKMNFKYIAYIPKQNYNVLTLCLFRRNDVSRDRPQIN